MCYYLYTFYIVNVEFVVTLNWVNATTLFNKSTVMLSVY